MQIRDNYKVIKGSEVDAFCALPNLRMLAIDTETYYDKDYLFTPSGKPVITRFIKGTPQNRPFCVTLYDCDTNIGYYVMQEDIPRLLPVLQSSKILKIFHNLNYDMHMLLNEDIEVLEPLADTVAIAVLTDEERMCKVPTPEGEPQKFKKSKALKHLGYHFFGEDAHDYEDEVKRLLAVIAEERGVDKSEVYYKDVAERCFELMVNYAIFDTELTGRLFLLLYPELERQELLKPYAIDMQAIISGVKIERNGMKVDIEKAKLWRSQLDERISELQSQIYALLGGNEDFNYNSSAELVQAYELLFDIKWAHFTEKEEYSTTAQVLKQFYSTTEEMKAFTDIILEIRTAEKISHTFIEGIIYYVQHTGRVHPNFHVVADDFGKGGTVTGRLSSSAPNFQNFPKEPFEIGGRKYDIRELFIADEGRIFVYMDADQQEYRLLGHYGKDEAFLKFVHEGKDIHKATASLLFGVPYDEVTKEQRKKAKTLNFGLVYGLGLVELAFALGNEFDRDAVKQAQFMLYKHYKAYELPPHKPLHIFPMEKALQHVDADDTAMRHAVKEYFSPAVQNALVEAKEIKKMYFAQFRGIDSFIKQSGELAKQRGWVKTWDGRKRHFADPKQEGYKAPNSIIQGGCGSMLKTKLPELEEALQGSNSYICNLVHDEVQFDMDKKDLHLVPKLNEILKDLPFRVPISWGIEYGYDWGHKFEELEN